MSSYKNIVQSITEPTNKNDLWLKKDGLYKFGQNGWEPVTKIDTPDPAPSYTVLKESYIIDVLSKDLELLDSLFYNLDTPLFVEIDNYYNDGYAKTIICPARIRRLDYGSGSAYEFDIIVDLGKYVKYYCISPENIRFYYMEPKNSYTKIPITRKSTYNIESISIYATGYFRVQPENIYEISPYLFINDQSVNPDFYFTDDITEVSFKLESERSHLANIQELYLYIDSISKDNLIGTLYYSEEEGCYLGDISSTSKLSDASSLIISDEDAYATESLQLEKVKSNTNSK